MQVAGIWALIIGLVTGIVLAGAIGSLLAIMNTASKVGYGNVISSLPGFKSVAAFLMSIKIGGAPLVSEFFTVNILAGITGSASGGACPSLWASAA